MDYEKIIERIANSSGLGKEELEKRVNAKREKLSGLISREGAAQVLAAELGISFDNEKIKIDEISPGMRRVNLIAKVINLSPVRTFNKNGQEGKVANIFVADETSNTRVVLWDANHIALVENGEISEGKVIEIKNAGVRGSEVHLGSFSELKLSNEVIENVQTERVFKEKSISDFGISDNVSMRAFIVQAFEPKFFSVCPECKRKVVQSSEGFVCQEHNKIIPENRALITIILDDGSATIRAVLFHEFLNPLGITELDDKEKLFSQRQNILGKEMLFHGNVRTNKIFNESEFVVNKVEEINIDKLIEKMERD